MDLKIIAVETNKDKMRFIKSQWLFYKDDKNFVPPVISDRKKVLDTEKNPFYKHSKIQLFLAVSGDHIVGRIAAIINDNHNITHNDKIGFWGFFECIDDQKVANALFNACGKWLKDRNMTAMRGPENPSMNDEIGLLIDGFDSPPVIMMTYNPQYYIKLVEGAGFTKAKDLYAYILHQESYLTDKMIRFQQLIRDRHKVTIRQINMKNKAEFLKDVETLKSIYNAAWMPNWGFVKWTSEEFDFVAGDLKMIADPETAIIAESNGKIAGFALALPNVNEAFIHNKSGGMIGALYHLLTKKKKINMTRIIALGVLPEFQKTGIDAVLYYEVGTRGESIGRKVGEASWILEDNEMMNRGLTTTMNAKVYKTYRLYDKNL